MLSNPPWAVRAVISRLVKTERFPMGILTCLAREAMLEAMSVAACIGTRSYIKDLSNK